MNAFDRIFTNPVDLLPELEKYRHRGDTIVFGNGYFDLFNVGRTSTGTAAEISPR